MQEEEEKEDDDHAGEERFGVKEEIFAEGQQEEESEAEWMKRKRRTACHWVDFFLGDRSSLLDPHEEEGCDEAESGKTGDLKEEKRACDQQENEDEEEEEAQRSSRGRGRGGKVCCELRLGGLRLRLRVGRSRGGRAEEEAVRKGADHYLNEEGKVSKQKTEQSTQYERKEKRDDSKREKGAKAKRERR